MKKILLFVFFLTSFFLVFSTVNAVGADNTLAVFPSKTEITADVGEKMLKTFSIVNRSNFYLKLKLSVKDYRQISEDGKLDFYNAKENPASSWLIPQYVEVGLNPLETKEISFIVNVQENLSAGGHYGAILFTPIGNSVNTSPGNNFGELVLLTVSGKGKINATANSISFWTNRVQQGDPVGFNFKLSNSGNTHFDTTGKVVVKNWSGKEIGNFNLGQLVVYPKTSRHFQWKWQDAPKIGLYKTEIILTDPNSSEKTRFTSGMWFAIFPWQAMMAILLSIDLIIGLIKFRHSLFAIFSRRKSKKVQLKIREVAGNNDGILTASLKDLLE